MIKEFCLMIFYHINEKYDYYFQKKFSNYNKLKINKT